MMAYKLVRLRADGTLAPLFINRKTTLPIGEWLPAEDHPTKGFAHRPGWHCTTAPEAPHLSTKGRVWCLIEVKDFERHTRPHHQGGEWLLAKHMKIVEVLGEHNATPRRRQAVAA